ncbi:hypothetical protein WJS89_03200 [Sphingomicrobium sp. XHP0235]|uniref:hypothetical protein n=1 Tax=Sphingomicrobium aquimarinum TaxID=3133971 RepID=UPI0031FEA1C5
MTPAFFCSNACPAEVILKVQDWANSRTLESEVVIGGFHTPVERDAMRIMLRSRAPLIYVLGRALVGSRISASLKEAALLGHAKLLSPFDDAVGRTTARTAEMRNSYILTLCDRVLFAHASPRSKTEALALEAKTMGLPIFTLPSPANSNLLDLGAEILPEQ